MSEQDKADIQNAKQFVLAAIDLIGKTIGEIDTGILLKWCGNAVKFLDDVEERNP